ncbi:transporter [Gracilimonas sp.]|uniref:transporter n=1 Tax=Gracilimonas sp. TaxID=1974203 RepID=UPI003BAA1121
MKYTHLITAFCFVLISNHAIAQENYTPDRPGIGNGSYVVEAGVFGLETGVQLSTGNAVNQFDIGQMLLRFGIFEKLELRALLNSYSTQYFDQTDAVNSGFQDLGLAAKYNLYEADQTRISALGKISLPVGASAFTNDEIVPTLFLVGDQALTSNVSISSNLGYTFGVGDLSDNLLFTLTPGFSFPNQQNLSAYAGYAGIFYGNDINLHYAEAGLALVVNDGAQLDLNAGYEFEQESFFIGIGFAQGFSTARR